MDRDYIVALTKSAFLYCVFAVIGFLGCIAIMLICGLLACIPFIGWAVLFWMVPVLFFTVMQIIGETIEFCNAPIKSYKSRNM